MTLEPQADREVPISPLAFWLKWSPMLHCFLTSFNPLPTKETAKVCSLCQCFPSELSFSLQSLKCHRHNFSQSQIASILLVVTDSLVFVVVRLSAIISIRTKNPCFVLKCSLLALETPFVVFDWLALPIVYMFHLLPGVWKLNFLRIWPFTLCEKNVLLYTISSMDLNIHCNLFNS